MVIWNARLKTSLRLKKETLSSRSIKKKSKVKRFKYKPEAKSSISKSKTNVCYKILIK